MATADKVVKSILQKLIVQASEAPIEASDAQDVIFSMNVFMADLDAKGVQLGYTEISDLGDEVTIPTGALRGLIYNTTMDVAPDFEVPITAALAAAAKSGLETMELIGITIGQTRLPSTLPIGSGNEGAGGLFTDHFFPDLEAEILAETTGAIGLETNTNEVADG